MSNALDFHVQRLNDLNLALAMVPNALYFVKPYSREMEVAIAVITSVAKEVCYLRIEVAAACAPWFDNSAFASADEAVVYAMKRDFERIYG